LLHGYGMSIAGQFIVELQRERRMGNVSSATEQHLKHEFRTLGRDASDSALVAAVGSEIYRATTMPSSMSIRGISVSPNRRRVSKAVFLGDLTATVGPAAVEIDLYNKWCLIGAWRRPEQRQAVGSRIPAVAAVAHSAATAHPSAFAALRYVPKIG
jgi:hypothetical protein